MVKVEEFQQYGKEQFDAAVASANTFSSGLQSIANAYGEYAKTSYETFVAESQKIGELYTDLAKQAFKPYEGLVAKITPTAH